MAYKVIKFVIMLCVLVIVSVISIVGLMVLGGVL